MKNLRELAASYFSVTSLLNSICTFLENIIGTMTGKLAQSIVCTLVRLIARSFFLCGFEM